MAQRKLTKAEKEELAALAEFVDATGKPSFMAKHHWPLYRALVRRGLVSWEAHPTMGPKFRQTNITTKGRVTLAALPCRAE